MRIDGAAELLVPLCDQTQFGCVDFSVLRGMRGGERYMIADLRQKFHRRTRTFFQPIKEMTDTPFETTRPHPAKMIPKNTKYLMHFCPNNAGEMMKKPPRNICFTKTDLKNYFSRYKTSSRDKKTFEIHIHP